MIRDLIVKNRSYRRFIQSEKISLEQLTSWVELARFSASGRNAQPLKYVLTNDEETNGKIFECLAWAGYLTDWKGPVEGEQPTAYITMLHDKSIADKYFCDDGIAAQSILLGAVEAGFGGCIIASVNRKRLSEILQIPEHLEIIQVLALGKPAEKVVIDDVVDGEIKYWRDGNSVHHVPKRTLEELIVRNKLR